MTRTYTVQPIENHYIVIDDLNNFVAKTYSSVTANLIAAAPDLLLELELLTDLAEIEGLSKDSNEWRSRLIYARAAIAKATGCAK